MNMVHRFSNAIWFQSNATKQAEVSRVNDKYRYRIFCRTTGKLLYSGNKDSLAEGKREVLNILEEKKDKEHV